LDFAFRNFFREINKGNKNWGYPKYKNKHDSKKSYRISNGYGKNKGRTPLIDIKNNKVKVPKLGWVKIVKNQEILGKIISVTITKSASNKYFISICTDTIINQLPKNDNSIGIDLGIRKLVVTSNNEVVNNPRYYQKLEKQIVVLDKKLSRQQKGSCNYNKTRIKLARLHEHIKNQRIDFLQKLSTRLIHENQVICLEKLDIKDMLEKHWFSKQLQDVSWYQFQKMLDYKGKWYGRQINYVDLNFPSTQLCNKCGFENKDITLDILEWICPNCNSKHDRDFNAAINILNEGLKQQI
jgi:putative transposase